MSLPEIKDILFTADGITDKPMETEPTCEHCGSGCVVPCIEEVLDGLRGNREHFREILTDTTGLLRKVCRYAEIIGEQKRRPAWSIIGEITGHGSGVSSAIYQLYRWSKD